jgi:hypothetical protein
MYLDNNYNLTEGTQLPYPNRPTGPAPMVVNGFNLAVGEQLPYPNYEQGNILAPMNPAFQLSAVPTFTVTSPLIPASMLTPTYAYGENVAPAMFPNQLGSTTTAYLAAPDVTVPGGMMQSTGDLRNVLEPILLADLLLGL